MPVPQELVGTKTSLAHRPQHHANLGMAAAHGPGQPQGPRHLGFPMGCSAPAPLSEDALLARTQHQPAPSSHEDGCQINPRSRDAKLRKKKTKNKNQRKAASHLPNQQFSAGFPKTLQLLKPREERK